jgi:precorrin-8X/cobalt-precorrin-8 methylmutase
MNGPWGYDLKPEEIERRSFEIIEGLVDLSGLSPAEAALVKRVVHATGDPSFSSLLAWSPGAVEVGARALAAGAAVVTDVEMVRSGVSKVRAGRFGVSVRCGIGDAAGAEAARSRGITRAMVAVESAVAESPGALFAFGNAPTALFRLLELVDSGAARPALVVGTVVGFVGAAESKEALMLRSDVPWISCRGNKGGSNVAAACVNALLKAAAGEV